MCAYINIKFMFYVSCIYASKKTKNLPAVLNIMCVLNSLNWVKMYKAF